jgi:hypothetical protein
VWISEQTVVTPTAPELDKKFLTFLVHHIFHNSQLPFPIMRQINPVLVLSSYFYNVNFNTLSHPRLGLSSNVFPSGFSIEVPYVFIFKNQTIPNLLLTYQAASHYAQ